MGSCCSPQVHHRVPAGAPATGRGFSTVCCDQEHLARRYGSVRTAERESLAPRVGALAHHGWRYLIESGSWSKMGPQKGPKLGPKMPQDCEARGARARGSYHWHAGSRKPHVVRAEGRARMSLAPRRGRPRTLNGNAPVLQSAQAKPERQRPTSPQGVITLGVRAAARLFSTTRLVRAPVPRPGAYTSC
jgi:hypothetical protein